MRYLGNKTRLLGEIESLLASRGVHEGTLIDIFSGSSSVGRHFKRAGFRVIANDLLASAYVQGVAGVEVCRSPPFTRFRARHADRLCARSVRARLDDRLARNPGLRCELVEATEILASVPPRSGLITRVYSPCGEAGRLYFTEENARRIDASLETLREARREGALSRAELALLLAAVIDAADRVANISGTYGAYLKKWQASALRPFELEVPEVVESPHSCRAFRADANRILGRLRGDVLYIDPPYNKRQYPANYHVLDVLAEHHETEDLGAYEATLYGKTGLRPWKAERSAYCVDRRSRQRTNGSPDVLSAFRDLVRSARVRHIVVSYNEEGLLSREEIGMILAEFEGRPRFDFRRGFREVLYRRFRSDRDRPGKDSGPVRRYRVVEGKNRDEIGEWLFIASRAEQRRTCAFATRALEDGGPRS